MVSMSSKLIANIVLNSSLGEGVAFRYCASVFSESGASKQMSLQDKCGRGRQ